VTVSQRLDRYELRGLLGRGAMGRVYRAWDTKLEREVALKLVSQGADAKSRERFHREVCAIAALRHPNIVEIYDYSGPDTDHLYYVMEKLDGDDLFNLMQAHGALPEPAVAAVGHELCLALMIMHEAGIIHRDLKPENVFLNAQGRVVLTDFGVVKAVREDSAVDGYESKTEVVGTPGFMAPELLAQKPLGSYTDLFSLGAVLYNLITGELPFTARSPIELHRVIMSGTITDPREYNPCASESFCDCLKQCLAARPKDRPGSATEVRQQLKLVLDAYGVSDIRDELSEYMTEPARYMASTRQRSIRRLVRELAAAVDARDTGRAASLRRRLLQVDPEGGESHAISSLIEAARSRADSWLTAGAMRRRQWLAVGLGLGLIAGVALLAVTGIWRDLEARLLRHQGTSTMPTASAVVAAEPSGDASPGSAPGLGLESGGATPAGSQGIVEVRVHGRAVVSVGGERLGASEQRGKKLPPGRYLIEVTSGRRRLTLEVEVLAGKRVLVTADVRHGRIRAQ
jgi:serine/threonine protein kinase